MSENKEMLEATVKGLQEKIVSLQHDLKAKEKELEDVNKPELLQSVLDIIYDCINDGIGEFDFDDSDNYDFEYELDYDGRVNVSNIDFLNVDYIGEPIFTKIENKFKIINDVKDETNE
mgnify:CR=1 FL=1